MNLRTFSLRTLDSVRTLQLIKKQKQDLKDTIFTMQDVEGNDRSDSGQGISNLSNMKNVETKSSYIVY